jgi:hypothetical protein
MRKMKKLNEFQENKTNLEDVFQKKLEDAKKSIDGINFNQIYDTDGNLILKRNEDGTYTSTEFYK